MVTDNNQGYGVPPELGRGLFRTGNSKNARPARTKKSLAAKQPAASNGAHDDSMRQSGLTQRVTPASLEILAPSELGSRYAV